MTATVARRGRPAAVPAAGDEELREQMAGLREEEADHQDRQDRRARVSRSRTQPGLQEAVGQEHERHPDRNDDREAEADAGEQVALLPLPVVGALELGQEREEERRRGDPDAEGEREELGRNPVDAGRDAAEDDRDDDHVRREDDLRRDLDQHVARAEGEELARLRRVTRLRRTRRSGSSRRSHSSGRRSRNAVTIAVITASAMSPPSPTYRTSTASPK